jgi:uncharacterized protein YxjI
LKLYLKQKVLTLRDRFFVKDENGNDRYRIEGKLPGRLAAAGQQLCVFDTIGNAVALVRHKPKFMAMPRFGIEIDGNEVCEVVKKFKLVGQRYNIEALSWHVTGFWEQVYELKHGDEVIMQIDKRVVSVGDSYELDILDPQHELLCLCIALAIDCSLAIQNSR